jgi:hypothetical protein
MTVVITGVIYNGSDIAIFILLNCFRVMLQITCPAAR